MSWWKSVAVSVIKVSSPLSMTEFKFKFKSPSSSLRRKKEWPGIDEEKVGKEEIRKCGETITKTIVKYCLVCRLYCLQAQTLPAPRIQIVIKIFR